MSESGQLIVKVAVVTGYNVVIKQQQDISSIFNDKTRTT